MDKIDKITIYILSGVGKIPDGWQDSLNGQTIGRFPVEVKMVGKGPREAGPPIGITLSAPFSIFDQLGNENNRKFIDAISEFIEINNGNCNFGLRLLSDSEGSELEINVASKNLSLHNIDNFFRSLEEKAGEFIRNIKPPFDSRWALYANLDSDQGIIRGITGLDLSNRDFYIYEMTTGEWVRQEIPENNPA